MTDSLSAIVGILEAFSSSGALGDELGSACEAALVHWAAVLDGPLPQRSGLVTKGLSQASQEQPIVLADQMQLFAVWKPPGWNATVGNMDEDLVEYSAAARGTAGASRPLHEWVAGLLGPGHPVALDAAASHGLAHRLDTYTSGALLCSKTYRGFYLALQQFVTRRVRKEYICLCHGWVDRAPRFLRTPLRVERCAGGAKRSLAVPAGRAAGGGRRAATELRGLRHLCSPEGEELTLVEVTLHTGRMHQIRAHLGFEQHPLISDTTYGGCTRSWCPRMFLHACRFGLDIGDGPMDVRSPLPRDLQQALAPLRPVEARAREGLTESGGEGCGAA